MTNRLFAWPKVHSAFFFATVYAIAFNSIVTYALDRFSSPEEIGPSPFQFGMEIEISGHQGLRNLVPYFEFKSESPAQVRMILETNLTPAEIESYLTPENFKLLPARLQQKLNEGLEDDPVLKFESKPIVIPQNQVPASQIVTSVRATPKPSLVQQEYRSAGGIILSQPSNEVPKDLIVPQIVKQEVKWTKIMDRWKSLSPADRLSAMSIEGLPANKKASLWMAKKIPQHWIKPRKTNSPEVAALLSNLEWENEGGLVEFRHVKPVNGKEPYLRNVELFSEMAGIKRYINDPNSVFPPEPLRYTYHVHSSRRGASLDLVADRLNRLLLLKMHEQGRGEGALKSEYGISNVTRKGLLRLIEKDHVEYRSHVESPRAELERYMPFMSRPVSEVVPELDLQIDQSAAKVRKALAEHVSKSATVEAEFTFQAADEKLDFLNRLLTSSGRPVEAKDLPELIGAPITSDTGQARLLKLLEGARTAEQVEAIFPYLNKKTIESQFTNLIPLTDSLNRSPYLYQQAIRAGVDIEDIHRNIKVAAIKYVDAKRGVNYSEPFSKALIGLLSPKERAELVTHLLDTTDPKDYRLLRPAFSGLGDANGSRLAMQVIDTIQKKARDFDEYETHIRSVFTSDVQSAFQLEIESAYQVKALNEKVAWRSADRGLIDSIPVEQKEVLLRILLSPEATDSSQLRAFERLIALNVPLIEIPLKEFFNIANHPTKFKVLNLLLEEAEKSNPNRTVVLDHLRAINLEDLMKYARNQWHKFSHTGVLQELANEVVGRPPTKGNLELVQYITWANIALHKDPSSMSKMTSLIGASSTPEWDHLLLKILNRDDYRYLGDGTKLNDADKKAVAAVLERSFRNAGPEAAEATSLYKSIDGEPKLTTAFRSTFDSENSTVRALFEATEAARMSDSGCGNVFHNLKRALRGN